jgi:hypothetical protein
MSTINRLSSVDALQPGDLIPVWDGSNGDTRKASLTTLLAFIESNFADPDYSTRIVAPAVDYFNVDIGATGDSIWMIINPTLNFTNGAVTLPPASSAVNDQEITMVFTASVSTFVITSAGATVLGTPVQINGYDSFRVRYNAAQQTWYNIGTTGSGSGSGVSQIVRQDFTGDGTTTTFALLNIPSALGNELQIFIDGVYQERAGYTVSGVNIIFSEAPPALSNIEVLGWSVSIGAETSANLVSYTPAGTGSVLTTVQAKLRESVSVLDFGAVGDGVTDDAINVQKAIDYVEALGGYLYFPRGVYLFGSQVTINRTYAASGSNFVGERNLIISGYGAEIRTTGAITAFDVKGGWLPNHNCLIEGFTIYHRGNTQALAGVRMIGAGLVTCRDVSVVVSSTLPAGYAAFSMENADPTNGDTGCFWNLIDQCSVRPWAGGEGFCDFGVKLMGTANATTLRGNTFSGSNTHVVLMAHPGQTAAPNAVQIDGNFFEAPSTSIAISLVSSSTPYHITGTRITNNRFEAINTAVSLTGTGTTVQLPTYLSANYADSSVTNYVVNASSIPIVMLDSVLVGAPMGPMKTHNADGFIIENDNGSFNPLTLKAASIGTGLELRRQSGDVLLGSIKYSNTGGGSIGMQLAGSFSPDYRPLTIKGCQGIAARDTSANNLAGAINFSASTSRVVTLPIAETDANYLIFLMPQADQKLWVSARTTTNFTVNSDVSSSNGFGWLLIRHL